MGMEMLYVRCSGCSRTLPPIPVDGAVWCPRCDTYITADGRDDGARVIDEIMNGTPGACAPRGILHRADIVAAMSDEIGWRVFVGGALGGCIVVLAICGFALGGAWCAATIALAGSWALREWSR